MRALILVLVVLVASRAGAQPCATGEARVLLEQAGARALLLNEGGLFYPSSAPYVGYQVPKEDSTRSVFAAALWMGGLVGGELHAAGKSYAGDAFWPGPLADDGGAPTVASCEAADRIWRVTLADIAAYNETGTATPALADWPAHLGAPVVDGDGDPDTYDLAAGDRPALIGDESAWWIMNDLGGTNQWIRTPPLGLEARVTAFSVTDAYAAVRLGLSREDAAHLHRATVYRYALTYRGDEPLEAAHVGLWLDVDLGNFGDDYIGSAPDQNIGYVYNGDNMDEGLAGYGESPPAMGVRVIGGPGAKPLSSFIYYVSSGGATGEPNLGGPDLYSYLQGRWKDGTPMRVGQAGYGGTGDITTYAFSGSPPTYWSEVNSNGSGRSNQPDDRRFIVGHGPFRMEPGETVEIDFAFVWARSTLGNVASVNTLVQEAAPAVTGAVSGLGPDPALRTILPADLPHLAAPPPEPPSIPDRSSLSDTAWPSPSSATTVIPFDLASERFVRLEVFDLLGRRVAVLVEGVVGAGVYRPEVDVAGWPSGLYVYRLTLGDQPAGTGRLMVAR